MRVALTVGVLLALLGASVAVAVWVWHELGEVEIGFHGLVALALGVAATLALGVGLMALMFFSARHGYDDRVQELDRDHRDPPPDRIDDD